jgi:beta-xylosidase
VGAVVVVGGAAVALTALSASQATGGTPVHDVSTLDSSSVTQTVQPPPDPTPAAPGITVDSDENQSDPVLYLTAGRYFLYTSGIPAGPFVNVPVSSSTDFNTWTPVTDALPVLPGWAVPGFTWAPEVHQFGTTFVLYFTAALKGTGEQCIGSSVSQSPTGPFVAETTPFICQRNLGGSIDPRVFTERNGTTWMLWKSDQNKGGSNGRTSLWSQRLSSDGLGLVGRSSVLMGPDEPWQGTIVEAPQMVEVNGTYWIFYSANWFNQPAYGIGAARCAGPAGPCSDITSTPLLASNAQGQGPGEESIFEEGPGVWMLYSPVRAMGGNPPRPVEITRLGFNASGPYLAAGGLPPGLRTPTGSKVLSGS